MRRKPLAADDPRHGTMNAYSNYGCKCELCKAEAQAHRVATDRNGYMREWRRKKRANGSAA
jgi:hypothetical protein